MFNNIFTKSLKTTLGLEITDNFMKLVATKKVVNGYKLENASSIKLPEDVVEGQKIKDIGLLSEILENLVKEYKIKNKKIAVAVSPVSVMTKIIQLDYQLNEDEIEQQLILDAVKHIPYSINEVRMDFQILGQSKDKKNKQDVLLVATHREPVDNYIEIIEGAGLKPEIVDVHNFVLLRLWQQLKLNDELDYNEKNCIAFIEVNAKNTRISIITDDETVYSEEKRFSHKITQCSDMDDLLSWYKRTLKIFKVNHKGKKIKNIFLYGELANTDFVYRRIKDYLSCSVFIANPFLSMQGNELDIQNKASYLIATGLAIREVVI